MSGDEGEADNESEEKPEEIKIYLSKYDLSEIKSKSRRSLVWNYAKLFQITGLNENSEQSANSNFGKKTFAFVKHKPFFYTICRKLLSSRILPSFLCFYSKKLSKKSENFYLLE